MKLHLVHIGPALYGLRAIDADNGANLGLIPYRVEYKSGGAREPWCLVGGNEPRSFARLFDLKRAAIAATCLANGGIPHGN